MGEIKIQKMKITAYSDIQFKNACGQTVVQINPDSFTRTVSVSWNKEEARKSKNGSGSFSSFNAEKYSFSLYFDGTGVVDNSGRSVKERVNEFLAVTYRTKGSSDESVPVYFIIEWCGEEFKCVADSIVVKYTLFNVSGAPLRANLTCSFSSVEKPKEEPEQPKPVHTTAKKDECPRPTKEEACNMCSGSYLSEMTKILKSWSMGSLMPKR